MLGVGVFIKAKSLNELAHFQLGPIIALFAIACILIVSMTFVFTSLVRNYSVSSSSFIDWIEKFCGIGFSNWAISFTSDFAQPVGLITTSIYLVQWISGSNSLWVWESSVIAILIGVVISTLNAFSFKWAELLQRFLSIAIFITMTFVSTFGIISFFTAQNGNNEQAQSPQNGINNLSGWTALLSGLPSIFFMYDGFYSVLSLSDNSKSNMSFSRIIFFSMCVVTLLYCSLISVSLLGDQNTGDFLQFHHLSTDNNWSDVLTILVMLTFLSSLNVSTICGQNQLLNLHNNYNFLNFQNISTLILNSGNDLNNAGLENRLSVWLFLLKRMVVISLLISLIAQLHYWISSNSENLFWSLNDVLAELNSLIIFSILGVVVWIASNKENKTLINFCYYISSLSILVGFLYYWINNIISFTQTHSMIYLLKLSCLVILLSSPAHSWMNTQWNTLLNSSYIQETSLPLTLSSSFNLSFLGSPLHYAYGAHTPL